MSPDIVTIARTVRRRAGQVYLDLRQRVRRQLKRIRERRKAWRARLRLAPVAVRHATSRARSGVLRTTRYWARTSAQAAPRIRVDATVRRALRASARGRTPIIAGPWLSEVGFEALYWVPFLRWFTHRYGIDRSRLVVVSRGGVAGWYEGVADRYVELFDLYGLDELAVRNAERHRGRDQKQLTVSAFDEEILARVRALPGLDAATLCHPSLMFRLLRQFWLGNDSLQYIQEYTPAARIAPTVRVELPPLPDCFTAVKFYTGRALPDTPETRRALRRLVERLAAEQPLVTLDTGLTLDEHEDYLFDGVPGVTNLRGWITPQNNLGVQTAVIQRASRFAGTCGGLAWLAPLLGIDTLAVYASDDLLTPHLYAARHAYREAGAAPFVSLDLAALSLLPLDGARPEANA